MFLFPKYQKNDPYFLANLKNNFLKPKLRSFIVMEPHISANIYEILTLVLLTPKKKSGLDYIAGPEML